jgi:hypothetical protein
MAELRERLVSEGATPLEVMLHAMRFYDAEASKAFAKLLSDGVPRAEAIKEVIGLRQMAGKEAARAAPYVHQRIGYDSGEGTGDPEFVPLAERLAYYQRRDEPAAAGGGNVVALKPSDEQ